MYLKNIKIYNNGPISSFDMRPKFKDGRPVPLVIIGENGTGKSILSSYLADFFIELAKPAFTNVRKQYPNFYRVVGTKNTQTGKDYSLVALECTNEEDKFYYFEVSGKAKDNWSEIDSHLKEYNLSNQFEDEIKKLNNSKFLLVVSAVKKKSIEDMSKSILPSNVICYFPPDRKENPFWISNEEQTYETARPTYNRTKYVNVLYNPVISETSSYENALWIASIVNDCLIDADIKRKSKEPDQNVIKIVKSSLTLKNMIQDILQKITKSSNLEILKDSRKSDQGFDILFSRNGKCVLLKNLSQLSNGEAVLFNLFVTILRYVDESGNISEAFNCESIKGIVVIDEIDMHLDTDLQYEVLPELIAMFPNIQFVITTHSPLFLLGLEKYKKEHEKDYDLIEMPTGSHISVEKFSEFEKAFNALTNTNKEEEKISKLLYETINDSTNVPNKSILLVTEGKTDVKHIRWALEKFKAEGEYNDLNILFLDYKDNDTLGNGQMSKYEAILSLLPKFDNGLKVVFLYDIDKGKYSKDLSYKKHGPSAYSFQLPLPDSRKENKTLEELKKLSFSIEHLFTDEEIKKEYVGEDDVIRRLYMGYEFDCWGNGKGIELATSSRNKCGEGRLDIIDASNGGVKKTGEADKPDAINYALSKDDFYEHIVSDESQHIGHKGFTGLFDKLLEIVNDN